MNLRNFRNEARDDYLEAILNITRAKGYCRSIDVATELDVSKPSVSVAVGKLQEAGLIVLDEDKHIRLTDEGRRLAELTDAKHRYLKAVLMSVGVEEETAEREACAIEHAVSSDTFQKLMSAFPSPGGANE